MLSQNQGVELSESLVDSNFADDGETDKSDVVPVSADDMDWKARCDEHATCVKAVTGPQRPTPCPPPHYARLRDPEKRGG